MKALGRFKNEVCCVDLVYADKLAKAFNCVKFFLVRQDLFVRTIDSKGKKIRDSKELLLQI